MSQHNDGHRKRLRERMLAEGLSSFQDHEILELLLFQYIPRKDTNKLAHDLLNKFGSFYNVLNASPEQLMTVDGVSQVTACNLAMLKEVWRRYNRSQSQRVKLSGVQSIIGFAQMLLGYNYVEQFVAIYVDHATNHIFHETFSSNSVETVQVEIKKMVATAVRVNAAGVVVCHCHPNGEIKPSSQDIKFTRNLFFALASLNIIVLDHIIFNGKQDYYSFFDNGVMKTIQADYTKNFL